MLWVLTVFSTPYLFLDTAYEYQQFFQHRICFSTQPPDYQWDKSRDYTCYSQWPVTHFGTFYQFILNMLFNNQPAYIVTKSKWSKPNALTKPSQSH
jgi:hypothetical protein